MQWQDFPWGPSLTAALALASVITLALAEVFRRKFLSKEDGNGMRERLERDIAGIRKSCEANMELFVRLDDRTGILERDIAVMMERQTQQWNQVTSQIETTAKTLASVSKEVQETVLQLERVHSKLQSSRDER